MLALQSARGVSTMFIMTKTHDRFVAELTRSFNAFVRKQGDEIKALRAERDALAGQVTRLEGLVSHRGARGRFTKREQVQA